MAVETSIPGYSSNLLVEEIHLDIDVLLRRLPEGETVGLGFIDTNPGRPSISYGVEVLQQAKGKPALDLGIYLPGADGVYRYVSDPQELRDIKRHNLYTTPLDEDTLEIVERLNTDPDTAAFVPWLPAPKKSLDTDIREMINPDKDVDGVSVNSDYTPATPEGMVAFANHILLNLPDEHPLRERYAEHYDKGDMGVDKLSPDDIWVFGFGDVVGRPLVEQVFPAHHVKINPENVFKNQDSIEVGADRLAVQGVALAFSAFGGAGGKLRAAAPNTILVDVGYAPNPRTGEYSGNADPDLVALNGIDGRVITAFVGGGGPVTIATVIKRAIERKLIALGLPHELHTKAAGAILSVS